MFTKYASREAALRHAANRWIKGGKLGETGKYIELDPFAEDDEDDVEVETYENNTNRLNRRMIDWTNLFTVADLTCIDLFENVSRDVKHQKYPVIASPL